MKYTIFSENYISVEKVKIVMKKIRVRIRNSLKIAYLNPENFFSLIFTKQTTKYNK